MAVYKGTQPIAEIDINVARAEEAVIMPLTATHNGTYQIEPGIDGYGPVTVSVPETPPPVIEAKSITANGTYTAPSGVDGYSPVTVNVPTGTARSASDVTVSGKNVTVPSGLYSSNVTKSVTDGTISLATPTIDSSGKVTASATLSKAGWIAAAPTSKTLQLTTQAAQTITPSLSQQTISGGKYLTGTQTINPITKALLQSLEPNFLAQNIISGVSVFGLAGLHPDARIVTGVVSNDYGIAEITHNLGKIPKLALLMAASMSYNEEDITVFAMSYAGRRSIFIFNDESGVPSVEYSSYTQDSLAGESTYSQHFAAHKATTETIKFNAFSSSFTSHFWLVAYWE